MAEASAGRVLIADDEAAIRQSVSSILEYEGFDVLQAEDGPSALAMLQKHTVDALLLDVKMPRMDGFELMVRLAEESIDLPVVVISGHDAVGTAVEAIRKGAHDFLEKPFSKDALLVRVRNAVEHGQLRRSHRELSAAAGLADEMLGKSPAIEEIRSLISVVGPTSARVLVTGENGTGKELCARAIHRASERLNGPFIEVNCAAIPEELIESELFGHEKGSFTGASQRRIGKFERAHRGTLFLDEIGDMSASAQAKVLRALQENRFERVGGSDLIEVDVRVLAATNRDLRDESLGFREDLFYRLNVIEIRMPALRERPGDIARLLEYFLELSAVGLKAPTKGVSEGALARLVEYPWPGNVRELRNLAERLAIVAPGPEIQAADLPPELGGVGRPGVSGDFFAIGSFQDFREQSEASFLQAKLQEFGYNVSRTAEQLGMQRSNLYKKIQKYDLRTSA